jgi:hypothetical protein
MTRKEARDLMDKRDAYVSKIGQQAATKYLRGKEPPPTRGNIRVGIAFAVLTTLVLVLALAL